MENSQPAGTLTMSSSAGRAVTDRAPRRPGSDRLEAIARVLDVDPAFFRAPQQACGDPEAAASFVKTEDGCRLVAAFLRIDDVKRRQGVLDLLAAMGERGAKANR